MSAKFSLFNWFRVSDGRPPFRAGVLTCRRWGAAILKVNIAETDWQFESEVTQ